MRGRLMLLNDEHPRRNAAHRKLFMSFHFRRHRQDTIALHACPHRRQALRDRRRRPLEVGIHRSARELHPAEQSVLLRLGSDRISDRRAGEARPDVDPLRDRSGESLKRA